MQWLELTVQTTPQVIDLVAANLTMLGYDRFILDDESDFRAFLEENRQYWDYVDEDLARSMEGVSRIRIYLEDEPGADAQVASLREELSAMRERLASLDPGPLALSTRIVRDEDWENSWKQYYRPIPVGDRLLVVPEWMEPEGYEDRVRVVLDPGMSFGTGAHASTQMCLRELETHIRGGESVLDLGSGSGILSIAALLLGADSACGVDVDPMAADVARENAAINGLGPDRFISRAGDVLTDAALMAELSADPWDVVLANIVADVIIPLSAVVPKLLRSGGVFICSGILNVRLDEVKAAIEAAGLRIDQVRSMDDWCAVVARPV